MERGELPSPISCVAYSIIVDPQKLFFVDELILATGI